jgi:hypothetical protein
MKQFTIQWQMRHLDQITPPTLTPIGKRDLEISVKPLDPWHHSLLSVHRKGIEISYITADKLYCGTNDPKDSSRTYGIAIPAMSTNK